MKWTMTLGSLMSAVALAGCAASIPYRSAGFSTAPDCRALYDRYSGDDPIGTPDSPCWKRSSEERSAYDLLFAEFDDQGWTQGTSAKRDSSPDHLDQLLEKFSKLIDDNRQTGVSLVVFVHGWHHSAAADDPNVRSFRSLLGDVAELEAAATRRHVVGIYVGWRGDSLTPAGLNMLTFWDRKSTAEKVAQGSVRELFARLDAMRDRYEKGGHKPVRMLAIGHSFGGLITFESLSGDLISGVSRYRDARPGTSASGPCEGPRRYFARVGDLVVIANPAFEGARYEALRAAAARVKCVPDDQWPVLITARSDADWATGIAFPVARWFNTALESDPNEERDANFKTVGHNDRYTTHKLGLCDPAEQRCIDACTQGATPKPVAAPAAQAAEHAEYVRAEGNRARAQSRALLDSNAYLCDGKRGLKLAAMPQWQPKGNPYWVVETSGDIMSGHNDIFNPSFVAFIRQMYVAVRTATGGD
jgi:pimeloyl-ACP methyl ester carboxylesterase